MTNAEVRTRLEAYIAVHGSTYASIADSIGLDKKRRYAIQRFVKYSRCLPIDVLNALDEYLKERGF